MRVREEDHARAERTKSEAMNLRLPFAVASLAAVVAVAVAPTRADAGASPCAGTSNDICLTSCGELVSRLDARVAPGVVACLRHANSGGTCVPPAAYACVENALPTTRRDARAETDCDRLAQICRGKKAAPDWRRNCSSVFPSLTAHGRAAVIACMSTQDCAGMPYFDDDGGSCVFDDHVA